MVLSRSEIIRSVKHNRAPVRVAEPKISDWICPADPSTAQIYINRMKGMADNSSMIMPSVAKITCGLNIM